MPQTTYNLHLKGFVGGTDFDRNYVDYILGKHAGKPVNVLIDSLGGSVATALSIASAFRNHSDVSVHFVGMNASAATIASLGAKHISIDTNAMYLVHKCSQGFFEWGSLNADQFATLIADCQQIKADLDKLDLNIASMYAAKCKKNHTDLLDLMKIGGWLTAQEAKEWGFVDEITTYSDETAPKLTDAVASEMAAIGMPIPNIPVADKESTFAKFLSSLATLFKPTKTNNDMTPEQQPTQVQPETTASETPETTISRLQETIEAREKTIAGLEKTVATLENRISALEKSPADTSTQIVDTAKQPSVDKPEDPLADYSKRVTEATAFLNALP